MSVQYFPAFPELGKLYGDYSPGSRGRGTQIFSIAGQLGLRPDGSLPGGGSVEEQVKQSFANVGTVLTHLGLHFRNVLRFNTFLVGRESLSGFMSARREVYSDIYPDGTYPPNTLLLVNGLVEEKCVIEIEATAIA